MATALFSRTAAIGLSLYEKQLLQSRSSLALDRFLHSFRKEYNDSIDLCSEIVCGTNIPSQESVRCVGVAVIHAENNVISPGLALIREHTNLARFGTTGRNTVYSNFSLGKTTGSLVFKKLCSMGVLNIKRHFHSSTMRGGAHSSEKDVKRDCWNCGQTTNLKAELFFCECGVVQKPAYELTFFELLQMDLSFDLDVIELGKIFRETQKKLHPDKFSLKSKEEQMLAEQQSSLLNKAYDILQKPLSRAIYILELENITISETDNFTDPEFLMEVMDVNEKISNAGSISDVNVLNSENDRKIQECIAEISSLFQENRLADAKNATMKLRYYTTIQERMKELHRESMG